jgi:hypothetical protein
VCERESARERASEREREREGGRFFSTALKTYSLGLLQQTKSMPAVFLLLLLFLMKQGRGRMPLCIEGSAT